MDNDRLFTEFVATRSTALLRTAYLLTGDHASAEDLVQEALLSVYRSRHRVRDPRAVEAYVRTTMVRTHVTWRRRRSGSELPTAELPERGADPSDPDDIWPLLDELTTKQRAVVVLAYYEDLPEARISELLGCSTGTVKSHRARALATLRRRMAERVDFSRGEWR